MQNSSESPSLVNLSSIAPIIKDLCVQINALDILLSSIIDRRYLAIKTALFGDLTSLYAVFTNPKIVSTPFSNITHLLLQYIKSLHLLIKSHKFKSGLAIYNFHISSIELYRKLLSNELCNDLFHILFLSMSLKELSFLEVDPHKSNELEQAVFSCVEPCLATPDITNPIKRFNDFYLMLNLLTTPIPEKQPVLTSPELMAYGFMLLSNTLNAIHSHRLSSSGSQSTLGESSTTTHVPASICQFYFLKHYLLNLKLFIQSSMLKRAYNVSSTALDSLILDVDNRLNDLGQAGLELSYADISPVCVIEYVGWNLHLMQQQDTVSVESLSFLVDLCTCYIDNQHTSEENLKRFFEFISTIESMLAKVDKKKMHDDGVILAARIVSLWSMNKAFCYEDTIATKIPQDVALDKSADELLTKLRLSYQCIQQSTWFTLHPNREAITQAFSQFLDKKKLLQLRRHYVDRSFPVECDRQTFINCKRLFMDEIDGIIPDNQYLSLIKKYFMSVAKADCSIFLSLQNADLELSCLTHDIFVLQRFIERQLHIFELISHQLSSDEVPELSVSIMQLYNIFIARMRASSPLEYLQCRSRIDTIIFCDFLGYHLCDTQLHATLLGNIVNAHKAMTHAILLYQIKHRPFTPADDLFSDMPSRCEVDQMFRLFLAGSYRKGYTFLSFFAKIHSQKQKCSQLEENNKALEDFVSYIKPSSKQRTVVHHHSFFGRILDDLACIDKQTNYLRSIAYSLDAKDPYISNLGLLACPAQKSRGKKRSKNKPRLATNRL